mmetsp:Transcript_16294/g.41303  ORF Transcript_16294/g.41303 Transcript_16294/m.41303 type:complete len:186 (+) Transcript_16294:1134-1691(+)
MVPLGAKTQEHFSQLHPFLFLTAPTHRHLQCTAGIFLTMNGALQSLNMAFLLPSANTHEPPPPHHHHHNGSLAYTSRTEERRKFGRFDPRNAAVDGKEWRRRRIHQHQIHDPYIRVMLVESKKQREQTQWWCAWRIACMRNSIIALLPTLLFRLSSSCVVLLPTFAYFNLLCIGMSIATNMFNSK